MDEQMSHHPADGLISRREFLKFSGTASAGLVLGNVLAALGDPDSPALRQPNAIEDVREIGLPPVAPLEVIALNRMGFGPTQQAVQDFRALGSTDEARLTAYITQQLNPDSIDDTELDNRITAMGVETLTKSYAQMWQDYFLMGDISWSVRQTATREAIYLSYLRATYSKKQLFEVLVDFWHNHFNIYPWLSSWVFTTFMAYDRDVIRAHTLGNFREMLEAVATSPHMLYYLDNYVNTDADPNENYARELVELHTMGAENYLGVIDQLNVPGHEFNVPNSPQGYVDQDVYEAARCFTGWRINYRNGAPGDSGEFLYYDTWHDSDLKYVLGKRIPDNQGEMRDGRDVLDLLATHPGTARFIARKLCRRLVTDDPPESLVEAAAQVFHDNVDAPDQIKRTVEVILRSDTFKSTWGEKIKRPFAFAIGVLRATNAEFLPSNEWNRNFQRMGQAIFGRPSPDGYPDTRDAWISTTSILQRWRLTNDIVENWIDDLTVDIVAETPTDLRTPNALADYWIERILGREMHPAENREEIVDFLAQGRNPDYDLPDDLRQTRLPRAVILICVSPDFQLR